jgi:hypothetical protein
MSLDTQNDIMLALAGLYPDGYDGFPSGFDTPQNYAEYAAMDLTEGATRHTEAELEEGRRLYETRRAAAAAAREIRASLNHYWESQPDFITGPMGSLFLAVQKHLDDKQPGRAYELVRLSQPPAYNEDEMAVFDSVRSFLLAEFAKLKA